MPQVELSARFFEFPTVLGTWNLVGSVCLCFAAYFWVKNLRIELLRRESLRALSRFFNRFYFRMHMVFMLNAVCVWYNVVMTSSVPPILSFITLDQEAPCSHVNWTYFKSTYCWREAGFTGDYRLGTGWGCSDQHHL